MTSPYPCRKCPDRYPACHDKCEKYQQARREAFEVWKNKRDKTKGDYELTKYRADKLTKRIRKYGDDIW